jgi:hypothetical protein
VPKEEAQPQEHSPSRTLLHFSVKKRDSHDKFNMSANRMAEWRQYTSGCQHLSTCSLYSNTNGILLYISYGGGNELEFYPGNHCSGWTASLLVVRHIRGQGHQVLTVRHDRLAQ